MNEFKNKLFDFAKSNGIDLIGVCSPEPFERYISELKERKDFYIERYEHRIDTWLKYANPTDMMDNARSVIVIGYNYYPSKEDDNKTKGKFGRIITYGHLGIYKKVKLIENFLVKNGYEAKIGSHRKEAAVRAGLAGVGKNSLLINEKFGSWVAYQTIVTNAELEYDNPYTEDICKDCVKCLEGCPTSALYEPYRLNPKKCLTYLLTTHEIPKEFCTKTENYIMGCDKCQDVCPKNENAIPNKDTESIFPEYFGDYPDLNNILNYSEKDFNRLVSSITGKFSQNSISFFKKIIYLMAKKSFKLKMKEQIPETYLFISNKLDIFKRNAIFAIKNSGDEELKSKLTQFQNDLYLKKYL